METATLRACRSEVATSKTQDDDMLPDDDTLPVALCLEMVGDFLGQRLPGLDAVAKRLG